MHNAGPRSLQFQRQPAKEMVEEEQRGFTFKALLTLGGYYSRESRHMRAAQRLYTAVTEQAVAPAFLQGACRCSTAAAAPLLLPPLPGRACPRQSNQLHACMSALQALGWGRDSLYCCRDPGSQCGSCTLPSRVSSQPAPTNSCSCAVASTSPACSHGHP